MSGIESLCEFPRGKGWMSVRIFGLWISFTSAKGLRVP